MKNKKNKWCVCGLGFVSQRHIQAIQDIGDEVIMACDNDQSKKIDYPFYDDWEKMMETEEFKNVDCVSIATPDYLHYPIIKKALEKGKRVLCEKPLTFTSAQCLTLPNDGSVGVILQLRDHPEVLAMKEAYIGENGKTEVIVCRENRYWDSWQGNPEQCGGILNNIGVHYLDLLLHVSGAKSWEVLEKNYQKNKAFGKFKVKGDAIMEYSFIIQNTPEGQDRKLEFGDKAISLSRQNNLSFEGWHTRVFRDFKEGKVIMPKDAYKTIKLIEDLKC